MDLFNNKNLKPMLLSEIDTPFNDKDYLFEIKFDGIRALIFVNNDEIIIKSRNDKILNDYYPELLNIKDKIKKKCIFDGEIVLMENDIPSFSKLQERMTLKNNKKINYYKENFPVTFVCFDILYEDKDLTNLTLLERKNILDKYKDTEYFVKSRIYNNGIKLFNIIKEKSLEGIIAKLKTSKYIPNKRTMDWIKIKNIKKDIYYICGYKEKENIISLLLGKKENNKLRFISKVIIGKKSNDYKLIKKCKIIKNNFIDFNELDYIYIEPKYKCNIIYTEKTKSNHLRHPVFKGIIK